jgi:hypothetical protein
MRRSFSACALALGLICAAAPLSAQQTVAAGVLLPIGDLDNAAATGFGIALRNENYLARHWSLRTDVGYEYFGGKGTVKNTQTTSFALNLVQHPTSALYAFGGAGLYLQKTTRTSDSQSRATNTLGFQGGVGVQLGDLWRFPLSAELAVVHTTGAGAYSWFPLRVAVGF